ncbi:MAG TPA: hypothetical protein VJ697_07710 [Nitrososphaeraceae archaeon]|nr:hypothetical protein [Nitrososphaeraceae archaeon]
MIFYRKIGSFGNLSPNMIDFGFGRQSIAERVIQQQQELLRNLSISSSTSPLASLNQEDIDSTIKEEQQRKIIARFTKGEDFSNLGFGNI